MRTTGIVSVTFRQMSPDEVIDITKKAGLNGIEWGGDIHVPREEYYNARMVGERTREAGLSVLSYGSYYRAGKETDDFPVILSTAKELGAPHIRIWAGSCGSADCDKDLRSRITRDCARVVKMAADEGISVSTEFHGGTLTDDPDSALRLIEESGIATYWQPNQFRDLEYNLEALQKVVPYVTGVHVFHWIRDTWLPLDQGAEPWAQYLSILAQAPEAPLMMEFVPGHSPKRFTKDAATLLSWLR